MMQSAILPSLSVEMAYLALAILLLVVHIVCQGALLTRDMGSSYNAGPRDEERRPGVLAARAERALRNYQETFPAFAALVLAIFVTGKSDSLSALGAGLYFWARLAYLPLYLAGIPYLRSLVWLMAGAGLALILWRLILWDAAL